VRQLPHPKLDQVELTTILTALGDRVRLRIVAVLAKRRGEMPWAEFDFAINKATLSHHMKTLRLAGIIDHRKEGTRCFVALRKDINRHYPGLLKAILNADKDRLIDHDVVRK